MKFIDCSCSAGLGAVNHEIVNHETFTLIERVDEAADELELVRKMDYCGIEKAFITDETMYYVSPQYGNKRVLERCRNSEKLLPVLTILPPLTDPEFEPEIFFETMRENGVKMLNADPHKNRYLLNAITMGELLSEIQSRRIPLQLTPRCGYEHIYSVLEEFPKLRIIVKNYGPWSPDRFWFPLLRKYKNVYFEIGDYETDGGLERLINKFGADNLLFGTEFPTNNMGGAIGMLMGAQIDYQTKEAVAYKNIERLMEEVQV